jgi:hypothetical protein
LQSDIVRIVDADASMKGIACSFCGKTIPGEKARGHVIAGANVFICRDCAEICIGVFASYDPEWRDLQIARLANAGWSAKTETIYVHLPEEGADVWRPVSAQHRHDDLYRLADAPPEDEVWEFKQGDTVRCRRRQVSGDQGRITDYLVAVEKSGLTRSRTEV